MREAHRYRGINGWLAKRTSKILVMVSKSETLWANQVMSQLSA